MLIVTLQRIAALENMYHAEHWHEAFIVLGTASAAISGLLIVATSVRAEQLMATPYWRLRARNSTLGMMAITIGSILVLLPQDVNVLGIELIVGNLLAACVLPGPTIIYLIRNRIGLSVKVRMPVWVLFLYFLAAAGGASLIVHGGGGLYLLLVAYFAILLTAVVNAYALLVPKF